MSDQQSSEIILTAAIVGAEVTREQTPYVPISAQEIAEEAVRCREARDGNDQLRQCEFRR